MDWRLNGRNAEQNYKIIIDKGAVRTGSGGKSIPRRLVRAGPRPRHPRQFVTWKRGSVVCAISQHTDLGQACQRSGLTRDEKPDE